tara:strand:+ start:43 stop:456 length:414 start_codon:yes stop_codon:yes gene_type:complete
MEKFLYFRKSSTLTEDHDNETGSVMYPVSALRGMVAGDTDATGTITDDDSKFSLFFTPMAAIAAGAGAAAGAVDNNPDIVVIDITTANTQKDVYKALVDKINGQPHASAMIDVFDAVNGVGIDGISGIHVITTVVND